MEEDQGDTDKNRVNPVNCIKTDEVPSTDQTCSDRLDIPIHRKKESFKMESTNLASLNSDFERMKIELYTEVSGPKIFNIKNGLVTRPLITKNLPEVFKFFPIHGRPKTKSKSDVEEFQLNKLKEFIGCDVNDEEFTKLRNYCSHDHLKTGDELVTSMSTPAFGLLSKDLIAKMKVNHDLSLSKKYKMRIDIGNYCSKTLKYRGARVVPYSQEEDPLITIGRPLEPGKDLIYRVRVYRPFQYNPNTITNRSNKFNMFRTRHSVFSSDMLLLGRQKLTALRDRLICANDTGIRVDLSNNPDIVPATTAKDLFPSGFLFINNVFYVDTRKGCYDRSEPIREWAIKRGMGRFTFKDMSAVRIEDLVLRLGHPEVYVHQGDCEHLFTFSQIRLLNVSDPLLQSRYPCHTLVGHYQSIYCTTCAEFGAKWIVVGCSRVPFDPAFFCNTCLKLYLYKDGKKIGNFKAYSYRGNEMNIPKQQTPWDESLPEIES